MTLSAFALQVCVTVESECNWFWHRLFELEVCSVVDFDWFVLYSSMCLYKDE